MTRRNRVQVRRRHIGRNVTDHAVVLVLGDPRGWQIEPGTQARGAACCTAITATCTASPCTAASTACPAARTTCAAARATCAASPAKAL